MGQFEFKSMFFCDVVWIDSFKATDNRGSFFKYYSENEYKNNGLEFAPCEEALIRSEENVIRGLHFQNTMRQSKLINCIYGKVQLVIVDINKESESLGKWESRVLERDSVVYIPGHYAIGTYAIDESLFYMGYGEKFVSEYNNGIRWDDCDLAIRWMLKRDPIVAQKDFQLKTFAEYINGTTG